jgi:hypothetical protein
MIDSYIPSWVIQRSKPFDEKTLGLSMVFHSNLSVRDRSRRNTRKIDPDAPKLKFRAQGFVGGRWTTKVFWARAAEATGIARRMFDASSEIELIPAT